MKIILIAILLSFITRGETYSQIDESSSPSDSLTWTIYINGKPNFTHLMARKAVAKDWGISTDVILGGCTANGELTPKQIVENEKLFSYLSVAYGSDWREKFDEELKLKVNEMER